MVVEVAAHQTTVPCLNNVTCALQTIVDNMRLNNEGRAISEDRVKGFASLEEANEWLLANPERTGARARSPACGHVHSHTRMSTFVYTHLPAYVACYTMRSDPPTWCH